ncbi:MAG: TlpA family protein disulfide reductase [Pseudomonadota bacterium]|nr:TlpA family protein disulfide reductase [Pseudomonadota bacterium]
MIQSLRINLLRIFILLVVLFAAAGIWYSLKEKPEAPQVTLTTVDGNSFTFSQLKGKAILVNFWATSCPGCVEEMPKIEQTYQKWQSRGFMVIAVAMSYDSLSYIKQFRNKAGLTFPVVYDKSGEISKSFNGIELTPTNFYIDPKGHVVREVVGATNFKKLDGWLQQTLVRN